MATASLRGGSVSRRIMCLKCGAMIGLSSETVFSLAPRKPTSLEEVRRLFSAGELEMLEIAETSKAYAIEPKTYLGRKAFRAISDIVKLAGGHYFSAGEASKFIIPKEQRSQ